MTYVLYFLNLQPKDLSQNHYSCQHVSVSCLESATELSCSFCFYITYLFTADYNKYYYS